MSKWQFVYVADIQPGSPKSFRFNPQHRENWQTAKEQIIELKPEFLLIGGDLTRDGSIHKWELEEMKQELDEMKIPYYVIPGNMDTGNKHTRKQGARDDRDDISLNITSEHIKQFESVFGESKWRFEHKEVRVSGFCDMLVNSELPEEKELWDWLEEQKEQPKVKHHMWLMHYALFINNPNEGNFDITDPNQYIDWYFSIDEPGRSRLLEIFKATKGEISTRVITGHIHCRRECVYEGINFDFAPGVAFAQWADKWPDGDATLGFFLYEVKDENLSKRFVPLKKISTAKGAYGPGGHPKPEARDYSLAWEK